MTWRGHGLAVLGIENQTKADYVLPERLLLYDALGYEVQRRRIARKHRREKSLKASAEYLSGFKKSDKLLAQVTIVIYYGEKDWEGPRRLSDLMEIPEELEPYFNNYQIYIFSINTSDGSEFKDPEVRKILKAAYCLRRKRIEELEPMSAEEVSVLAAFVNSERLAELAESGEEEIEMCTALEEMIAEGEERGLKQGIQRGTRETAAHMVRSMYKKGFDAEVIAGTLEWPLEKVKEYIR
ncbi:MAG TPA: Rpn family recombination-promoting nuclease/putative transposase [Candidatus Choladousia intestinavium]|uniref:Rpn family recombination-promoting nuclease/putative transposase n=1 Tax=Candidatus Choladousia intestinavium TaxID=2840727 RepID=A0A9D1ABF7_9FIRM|nr:Rpn family recombination-promoting nuclease/putative transposase [Candidatus Choladousia intestinavium]